MITVCTVDRCYDGAADDGSERVMFVHVTDTFPVQLNRLRITIEANCAPEVTCCRQFRDCPQCRDITHSCEKDQKLDAMVNANAGDWLCENFFLPLARSRPKPTTTSNFKTTDGQFSEAIACKELASSSRSPTPSSSPFMRESLPPSMATIAWMLWSRHIFSYNSRRDWGQNSRAS